MIATLFISILLSFLIGYIFGEKKGMKSGEELGISYAILMIRKESFANGQCKICNFQIKDCNESDCHESPSVIE